MTKEEKSKIETKEKTTLEKRGRFGQIKNLRRCDLCSSLMEKTRGDNKPQSIIACDSCKKKYHKFRDRRRRWGPSWLRNNGSKQWYSISKQEKIDYILRNNEFVQSSTCEWCGSDKNLQVDHCHTSGEVRGLLCHRCNTVEAFLQPEFLAILRENNPKIKAYFERFEARHG